MINVSRNSLNRFEVAGILDPGKKGKAGIAGYRCKCKFFGWILEKVFRKFVAVQTKEGLVYLNCKSFTNWLDRVQPGRKLSKKELEKSSHDSKFIEKAIADMSQVRVPVVPVAAPVAAPSTPKAPVVQAAPIKQTLPPEPEPEIQYEDIELPVMKAGEGVTESAIESAKAMLQCFQNKKLLGSECKQALATLVEFKELTRYDFSNFMFASKEDFYNTTYKFKLYPKQPQGENSNWCRFGLKEQVHKNNSIYELGIQMELIEKFHHKDTSPEKKKKLLLDIMEKMQSALDVKIREEIIHCLDVPVLITEEALHQEKTEILPGLFLGRSDDEEFDLVLKTPQVDLKKAISAIDEAMKRKEKVLVSCAFVIAAYLKVKYNVAIGEAVNLMRIKRPSMTEDISDWESSTYNLKLKE